MDALDSLLALSIRLNRSRGWELYAQIVMNLMLQAVSGK